MVKFRGFKTGPSRRHVVNGAAALLAGIASPAILSFGPALAVRGSWEQQLYVTWVSFVERKAGLQAKPAA